ncbi:hypothetical protein ACFOG5_09745 [Pedobacter fastidiosus]|uniref:Uncharacterized protein n=1 Tax=Pedobacter fastidiosus TaxID=2765361 RepID=A0ABR7KYT4_9SPHI|nr:hypothetical protein [Pedobacter fastidiosus]MBC6112985.1 hypothetical protein [Pedobacter fastidiosus]
MIHTKQKKLAEQLIISRFNSLSVDYKNVGGEIILDNNIVSTNFTLRFKDLYGNFNIYGKGEDDINGKISYRLKPQWDDRSEITQSNEAREKIKKDLLEVENFLNSNINN